MRGLVLSAGLALSACGLSVVGIEPTDQGDATAPPGATSLEAGLVTDGEGRPGEGGSAIDGGVCRTSTCGVTVAPGWSLVAFGAASCSAGFTSQDVLEEAKVEANACRCSAASCAITPPSCNTGTSASRYDGTNIAQCNQNGNVKPLNNGACVAVTANFSVHAAFPAPAPTGGSCTAEAVPDPAKWTAKRGHICAPPTCEDVCGQRSAGFQLCLLTDGDKDCPADMPEKHRVGTGVEVTCGACSSCNVTATCSGTMKFFSDSACANEVLSVSSTECVRVTGIASDSYRWSGVASGVTCAASGPPPGAASLQGRATLCCK